MPINYNNHEIIDAHYFDEKGQDHQLFLGYVGGKIVYQKLEDGDNLLEESMLDMSKWEIGIPKYYSCFYDWKYYNDAGNPRTNFRFKGVSGWETIGAKVTGLTPGKKYTWQFQILRVFNETSSSLIERALSIAVLKEDAFYDMSYSAPAQDVTSDVDYKGNALAQTLLIFSPTEDTENADGIWTYLTFTAETSAAWIATNWGKVYDSQVWNVLFGKMMVSEGDQPKNFSK